MHLVGTDGWVAMPDDAPADPPFFPDSLAPSPFNTYVFGFRDVTGMTAAQVVGPARPRADQRADAVLRRGGRHLHHADQPRAGAAAGPLRRPHPALARVRQRHPAVRRRPRALARRPGRPRLHLLLPPPRRRHVHVPLPLRGRRARADGHDRHGLRPAQAERDGLHLQRASAPSSPTTTATAAPAYDREFAFMLTELWSAAHYRDAHIQVNDWTDYDPSFWLLNGRAYPDTLAANGEIRSSTARGTPAVPADLVAHPAATRASRCCCGCRASATRTTR